MRISKPRTIWPPCTRRSRPGAAARPPTPFWRPMTSTPGCGRLAPKAPETIYSRHLREGCSFLTAQDPRNTPSYRLNEAAHYLRIPKATLRSWLVGQGSFKPVIAIADRSKIMLSFINLVEAHVLHAIPRQYEVSLQKVRQALVT